MNWKGAMCILRRSKVPEKVLKRLMKTDIYLLLDKPAAPSCAAPIGSRYTD